MPRTKAVRREDIEPTFLGVRCLGPNSEKAKRLRFEADANLMLAKFYELPRSAQLAIAAATTEITINRES